MRNFTYLVLAASIAIASTASAAIESRPNKSMMFPKHSVRKAPARKTQAEIKALATRADNTEAIWRAASQTAYAWDGRKWQLDDKYTMKYDNAGRVTEELAENFGTYYRTTYSYDERGMETMQVVEMSEDGENFEYSSKKEREYDPIIPNLIVKNRDYEWIGGKWEMTGNNYNRTVTRNSDGNVTNVEIAVLFEGEFDPTIRIEIAYGDDGTATSIKESLLTYDGKNYSWVSGISLDNITWVETDGQIVEAEVYASGANRMKSLDMTEEEDTFHAEITYEGNNYTTTVAGTAEGADMKGVSTYEQLDEYGSFRQTSDAYYTYEGEGTYHEVETYTLRYDAYGNMLESKDVVSYDGEEEIFEDLEGTVEYDPTYGYPLSYIMSEGFLDYATEEYVKEYVWKIEYSDYYDAAAKVTELNSNGTNAEAEYFTLQGIKVEKPAAGNIYIRKTGNKTSKIIAR